MTNLPNGPAVDLTARVVERLDAAAGGADESWKILVLAALDGPETLATALASEQTPQPRPPPAPPPAPRRAYLRSIAVEGFRGIGPRAVLEVAPGPGLTVVMGRNGSGKSSFAEALELLLTGQTFRWKDRSTIWREGWRNLHHGNASIGAEFSLEGESAPCTVSCAWAGDADLDDAVPSVQVRGKAKTDLTSLGWTLPLQNYRPFLSYSELGSMLAEGPSHLYDALAVILGLDQLVRMQDVVSKARLERERTAKQAAKLHREMVGSLAATDDDRVQAARTALQQPDWGLTTIADLLAGTAADDSEGMRSVLARVAGLVVPSANAVAAIASRLRAAAARRREAANTLTGRAHDLADVLERTLHFHTAHGDGICPVCGRSGVLNAAWHEEKAREAAFLRETAAEVQRADQEMRAARQAALALPQIPRDVVTAASVAGLEPASPLVDALSRWDEVLRREDLAQLADGLETEHTPLANAAEALRRVAAAELQRRDDAWRPQARLLTDWLPLAREVQRSTALLPQLKRAEAWIKETTAAIRDERFAPIAAACKSICDELLLRSNVQVEDIQLAGGATQRRVDMNVTVDGVASAALGVMSQGELHALALSLFLPRAMHDESPFGFMVIDDPVQSMDPARVDGLARVLDKTARTRQVVVFTHDDRLPESLRRLNIAATILEVLRREHSAVAVGTAERPVLRYIKDAMTLAYTDNLSVEAARRVIPGLCRLALEAACQEAVRRRRLGRGEGHAGVEDTLVKAGEKTSPLMSLALFDTVEKAGEIYGRLSKQKASWADAYRAVNEGVHGLTTGQPAVDLIRDCEKLAEWVRTLP